MFKDKSFFSLKLAAPTVLAAAAGAFVLWGAQSTDTAASAPGSGTFDQTIAPFVKQNCALCHNDQLKTGGLVLTKYHDVASMLHDRDTWENVVRRVRAGEMPPKGMPRPQPEAIAAATNWIEAQFDDADRTTPEDPGHLTAHRLNRTEYDNTIRDLLAVKFKPAADFPADDSGYGFDNIGDVLSVSPTLMEKYLNAATRIANRAIPSDSIPRPTRIRYSPEHSKNDDGSTLENTFEFPAEGDYEIRTNVGGKQGSFHIVVTMDGKSIVENDVLIEKDKPRSYLAKLHVPFGEHKLLAVMTPRDPSPTEIATAAAMKAEAEAAVQKIIARHPERAAEIAKQKKLNLIPPTYVDSFEIRGPYNALHPPLPEAYHRIFICGHLPGQHTEACIRRDLSHLATLAYRRPVKSGETDELVRLVQKARKEGMNFDQSMRIGVEAILVSPNFLFRMERDPANGDPSKAHPVNDYELASRLSYFLWSSMPDHRLFDLAAEDKLQRPEVLNAEVKRMLQDPKSQALIDNFAGQWLELRNLDSAHPDPDEFPQFNAQLRKAIYTETEMFFTSVVRDDRSILDFIDGKYTFVNERLAKFYGIPGVTGNNFRRVPLDGTERSGVLTQASVLTVTSYPTRTSPVLRGKWILENILNTPPPPPPPGVGSIDAKPGPLAGTMRQQMEKHRANPMCASCHQRMDPLGFALENYDAIGQWRTHDANQPIDASGVLPNGDKFNGSNEMKAILATDKQAFAECLTEKLMTYALGRGLESYDRRAENQITAALATNDYKFSTLITGIVNSVPFRMGRGDESMTTMAKATGGGTK